MAAQENHLEVVKFLLDNGASQSLATEVKVWISHFMNKIKCASAVILASLYQTSLLNTKSNTNKKFSVQSVLMNTELAFQQFKTSLAISKIKNYFN